VFFSLHHMVNVFLAFSLFDLIWYSLPSQHSLDAISERGDNTDDSGSVGSESDGTGHPGPTSPPEQKRKRLSRSRAETNGHHGSGSLEAEGSESEGDHQQLSSSSHQTATAFASGDGSFDTIKRKKTASKMRGKQPEDRRHSDSEQQPPRRSAEAAHSEGAAGVGGEAAAAFASPPSTPRPASELTAAGGGGRLKGSSGSGSPFGSELEPDSMTVTATGKVMVVAGSSSSTKNSPSTSPPLVSGPVRKHKSRDSGFVGTCWPNLPYRNLLYVRCYCNLKIN
jgi:hypothetical protein